jgi:rhodanese-related sulfurtransferase
MSRGIGWGRVAVLIALAVVCAAVANLAAAREKKLPWVGTYSRALETGPVASAAPSTAALSTPQAPVPASAAPAGAPVAGPSARFPAHPDKASVEITTDDAEALFREGRLFLDARRSSVYADGHVPGARSFPVWESDIADRVKAFFEEGLDQNAPIVIYCSGGDCEDSHMLAEKLYMVGFNALYVDKDGFPAWVKKGLPVNKGAKP